MHLKRHDYDYNTHRDRFKPQSQPNQPKTCGRFDMEGEVAVTWKGKSDLRLGGFCCKLLVHHRLPELRHLALDVEAPVDDDELIVYNKSRPIGGPTSPSTSQQLPLPCQSDHRFWAGWAATEV